MAYNHHGQPFGHLMLADRAGTFGTCVPIRFAETVLIEYSGDPDVYPGCERIQHHVSAAKMRTALTHPGSPILPSCRARLTWWELGPARRAPGWTWCRKCWHTDRRIATQRRILRACARTWEVR